MIRLKEELPWNPKVERAVLGGILLDSSIVDDILDILGNSPEEAFFDHSHRTIFSTILKLYHRDEPVDIPTVIDEIKKNEKTQVVGGEQYIASLIEYAPSATHALGYAKILKEKKILRDVITKARQIIEEAQDGPEDINSFLDMMERTILGITRESATQEFFSSDKIPARVYEIFSQPGARGLKTRLKNIDSLISGLQPSEFIIIAARPGIGKTSFALTIARNISLYDRVPVAIFSLEMSIDTLLQRLISMESRIDTKSLTDRTLTQEEKRTIMESAERLSKSSLYINDSIYNMLGIRSAARRLKSEKDIGIIIIDYLQQIVLDWRAEKKEQEVANISRMLKALAKELNIPIVALSQLSRNPERRGKDRRPELADLRESGSLEQDADIVILLYREGYYIPCTCDEKSDCTCGRREGAEANVAKNRNGPTGTVELKFLNRFCLFEDKIRV